MNNKMTFEAWLGLAAIVFASIALVFFFSVSWTREPLILENVVQTQAADMLTHIPTHTPWVITATPTPTPTPTSIPRRGGR